jgi:hypothetical protein
VREPCLLQQALCSTPPLNRYGPHVSPLVGHACRIQIAVTFYCANGKSGARSLPPPLFVHGMRSTTITLHTHDQNTMAPRDGGRSSSLGKR